MKSILTIQESSLNPHHRSQNFDSTQEYLFDQFLENPDDYTQNAVQEGEPLIHSDGRIERWRVQLDTNFFVYIDCSVPLPWSTSDSAEYLGLVIVIGYEIDGVQYQI